MAKKMRSSPMDRGFGIVCYSIVVLFSLIVLLPFWTLIMDAFSGDIGNMGARFWIKKFTLDAWHDVFSQKNLGYYYANTVFVTVVGTLFTVTTTYLAAYPLSKPNMPFNRTITFLMLITMYFSGGLIPTYLLYKDIGLHDSLWVMILPSMFSAYYILVMRNFLTDNLVELEESAKLDGANDYIIAFRIFLPLAKPIIATIALWSAVGQWNAWYAPMIYITTPTRQVMQVILRRMLIDAQTAALFDDGLNEVKVSEDSVKAVSILITILPIICTYPFAQKYFIKGLTSGAVKG